MVRQLSKRLNLNMHSDETIAAIATAHGIGGVAIVRISGQDALAVAERVTGKTPAPRTPILANFYAEDGALLDQGLVLYFPAPASFTGEDVVELQGHGGMAVSQAVLQAVIAAGARIARAGEFSQRAFLNDKIDLAQAEAIADLIEARSQAAVKAASRSLSGEFSNSVRKLADSLLQLRLYIEAALDFPEEEIDFLTEGKVFERLCAWQAQFAQLQQQSAQGALLNKGIELAIVGKPNAGKSSLFNALIGDERAIVTSIAGTTRDINRESLLIEGIPVQLLDTAGIRESADQIEQEGIRRARKSAEQADVVIELIACDELIDEEWDFAENSFFHHGLRVYNKIDVCRPKQLSEQALAISVKTGEGLAELRAAIVAKVGGLNHEETAFIARERHLVALKTAQEAVERAQWHLQQSMAGELIAEELKIAHQALGEITGKMSSDELLGAIFSSFCIGK